VKTRMKEYRNAIGLTQEQLAEIVGVRRETIIYVEKGKYNPSLKLAHDIARTLKALIEDIFLFDDETQ
jgi:putative transcriptional regulator